MVLIKALLAGLVGFSLCMAETSGTAIKTVASAGRVSDADGNVYQTVKIGNQVWMAENLRVTRYRDGSAIPLVKDSVAWYNIYNNNLATPAYCFYNNTTTSDSIKKYGVLYNWYVVSAANLRKIAPTGWHVPSDSEWNVMVNYMVLNGYNWDGTRDTSLDNKIAKSLAEKTDWHTYSNTVSNMGTIGNDLTKNNRSGFSALPGGFRNSYGSFFYQSYSGYWWSATEGNVASDACTRALYVGSDDLGRSSLDHKSCGISVRLLRD